MLNPGEWNWGLFTGFFWAGFCFLCILYTYFRIPEPAGRTFAELDLLFEKRISARNFAKTKVDVFDESVQDGALMSQYERKMSHAASHEEEKGFGVTSGVKAAPAVLT